MTKPLTPEEVNGLLGFGTLYFRGKAVGTVLGMKVELSERVDPGTAEMRDAGGKLLGKITGLPTDDKDRRLVD